MNIGIWPWVVLLLGLFVGFVALVILIIAIIKTKKFLLPILIYLPFLFLSLILIGVFTYKVVVYYTDDYNYDYDDYYDDDYNYDYNYNYNGDYNYYDGLIENIDYNYVIDVGDDLELNFWETKEYYPLDGVTDTYYYCYLTMDTTYEDYNCGTGWAQSFSISVYTENQWLAVKDSPLVGTLMGQDGGYYFVLAHPNGILPSDVPATDVFYNSVIYSIYFTD